MIATNWSSLSFLANFVFPDLEAVPATLKKDGIVYEDFILLLLLYIKTALYIFSSSLTWPDIISFIGFFFPRNCFQSKIVLVFWYTLRYLRKSTFYRHFSLKINKPCLTSKLLSTIFFKNTSSAPQPPPPSPTGPRVWDAIGRKPHRYFLNKIISFLLEIIFWLSTKWFLWTWLMQ